MDTPLQAEREDVYLPLLRFAEACNRIPYYELDNYTVRRINLFMIPKDEHFRSTEITLDKIIRALPSLKRIFTKPIIRLKDVQSILPVESVRVINNQSVAHISRHSELWGDITEEGLKPRKLMTLDRQEDYAIYENVAFARLVHLLLAYVRENIRLLKDILYAYRDLRFNLLERTNHLNHFLAIGKLHIGYARAQDSVQLAYERCLEKLLFIDKTLRAHLHCPVYQHCKKIKTKLTLKKTNIFRLHKDYKQVYSLLKWLNKDSDSLDEGALRAPVSQEGYETYCTLLSLFAVGHFNFDFQRQSLDFFRLHAASSYLGWKLHMERVRCGEVSGLRFSFFKEREYRICLLFSDPETLPAAQMQAFKLLYKADEYLTLSPTRYGEKKVVYLSIYDIESFRRIQQIVLRGMVYSDGKRDTCPFCGHSLTENNGFCECEICKTRVFERVCPTTGERYFATDIGELSKLQKQETVKRKKLLSEKFAEAQMYYRNVTALTASGEIVCPRCGKIHT